MTENGPQQRPFSALLFIFQSAIYLPNVTVKIENYNLFKISVSRIELMLTLFVCNKMLSDLTQSFKKLFEEVFFFFIIFF